MKLVCCFVTSHTYTRPHFPALCTGHSYLRCDWLISVGVRLDWSSVPVINFFVLLQRNTSLYSLNPLPCHLGMRDTLTLKITWDFGTDVPVSFTPGIFLTWIVRLLMFKPSSVFVALIRLGLFLSAVSSVTLLLGHVFCISWTFLQVFPLLSENVFLCSFLKNFWSPTSSLAAGFLCSGIFPFKWRLVILSFLFFFDILCLSFVKALESTWIDQTKNVILSNSTCNSVELIQLSNRTTPFVTCFSAQSQKDSGNVQTLTVDR